MSTARIVTLLALSMVLGSRTGPLVAAEPGALLAEIAVDSGESARLDTPVGVALPVSIDPFQPLRLEAVQEGERRAVPCQVEPGSPTKLWFVLDGETPANTTRKFALSVGVPVQKDGIQLDLSATTLDVKFSGARVFSYNHGHVVPPPGVRPEYIRSGYIHPLFSPSGKLLTEDFPADHHHHKGIWFPWTKTEFEGKAVDFWNLGSRQGTVQFAGFDSVEDGPIYGRFLARHEHVHLDRPDGPKVALDETWDVRIWNVGGPEAGLWVWDLESTQRCASDSPLHLKKYRYGGIGFRGAREWKGDNYVLLTSEGKTKENGHTTRARWCAQSGSIDGQWTTIVMMSHPENYRFPEPMRIWASGGAFFNFTPIQLDDWDLEPGNDYVFRYRFFIHEGKIDPERAERAWQDFGAPPRVTLRTSN